MIKQGLFAVLLIVATQITLADDAREDNNPNRALVMWSAFSCATYAEMSGNKKEQERLFEAGFNVGRSFVNGVKHKTIAEKEVKDAPIGVLMHMGGPTTDFIIGRIFEAAAGDAYDKVVKEDSAGLPILDPSKWADDKLKVIRAQDKYQSSNCTLIRAQP